MTNPHPLTPLELIIKIKGESENIKKRTEEISKPKIEYSPDNLKNAEAAIKVMKDAAYHINNSNHDLFEYLDALRYKLQEEGKL